MMYKYKVQTYLFFLKKYFHFTSSSVIERNMYLEISFLLSTFQFFFLRYGYMQQPVRMGRTVLRCLCSPAGN